MIKIKVTFIIALANLFISISVKSQAHLVLNGGFLNINNGATLIIDNPNSNAIIRTSGHIISEAENNAVKWNIGSSTGNYIVPFGYGSNDYLPITFTPTGGNGNGSFLCSTYYGGSATNSNYLPTGVSNYNYFGNDNSNKGIDRFWQVQAIGYTTKPALSNLQLSYREVEYNQAPNTISEASLLAKRWNPGLNQWDDFLPLSTINTLNNTVTIPSLTNAHYFNWWTLMNASSPLPVELLSFTGRCNGSQNILSWTTATELNNDYFELQRSEDAIHFHTIQLIKSKAPQGNSTTKLDYEVIDDNILNASIYYRLQQFDLDHHAQYSTVVELRRKNASDRISMYPNPSHGNFNVSIPNEYLKNMMLYIQNIQGETIYQQAITNTDTNIQWPHSGVYLLTVKSPNFIQTQKIFIQAN